LRFQTNLATGYDFKLLSWQRLTSFLSVSTDYHSTKASTTYAKGYFWDFIGHFEEMVALSPYGIAKK
jgi:hypothetical protein